MALQEKKGGKGLILRFLCHYMEPYAYVLADEI